MKGLIAFTVCVFAVGIIKEQPATSRVAYSFVCFDQWQNSTRRPGIVQHTLKDGGVYVLKRQDGTTSYYMQQHGEDCYPEQAAQKRTSVRKVK